MKVNKENLDSRYPEVNVPSTICHGANGLRFSFKREVDFPPGGGFP
jgi:hypothetical protein